jgi:hypothetical protein
MTSMTTRTTTGDFTRTTTRRLATVLALSIATALSAQNTAVSPADRAGLEGSSYSHYPLGRTNTRLVQLHGDVPPGMVIQGHAYRRDAASLAGTVAAFVSDLEVTLSIAPVDPAHASTTFANNVGSNPLNVLPRTQVAFPATSRPAIDPSPAFDFVIPYQVPFVMPPTGGTLCVDTSVFGNTTASGTNRNFSVYLDAHQSYTDGRNEQPGFRMGSGCPAPGATNAAYANLTLWHMGSSMQLDVSARNGVPDDGTGNTQVFAAFGLLPANLPWPTRPSCLLLTSTDAWFPLPGNNTAQGAYDGSLTGLPVLPAGFRMYCQTGSLGLPGGDFAFGDASAFITPPAGTLPIPAARIANANDNTATTGTVSFAVTVTQFF